jgi:hypothetical protein
MPYSYKDHIGRLAVEGFVQASDGRQGGRADRDLHDLRFRIALQRLRKALHVAALEQRIGTADDQDAHGRYAGTAVMM